MKAKIGDVIEDTNEFKGELGMICDINEKYIYVIWYVLKGKWYEDWDEKDMRNGFPITENKKERFRRNNKILKGIDKENAVDKIRMEML